MTNVSPHRAEAGSVISPDDIRQAAEGLVGVAHRTPVLTSRTLDERCGVRVLLKAEHLQRAGSFKIRGAYTKVASIASDRLPAGVAAYSSGNHAQAVALAARLVGTGAVILMPEDAPASKVRATLGYGAEIVTYDRYREDRVQLGQGLAADRGMTLIPPYDDPMVIAGQGTASLELLQDEPDLEVLVVPIGGGGLIAGSATAAKGLRAGIEVVGVEPAAGDDTRRSLERGERIRLPEIPRTIADGLQVDQPGELTFEVNRRLVDRVVTVTDAQIVEAMRFLFERVKAVVEPSGAVGVAALLSGAVEAGGRRIGVILSGGNVDTARFASLVGGDVSR